MAQRKEHFAKLLYAYMITMNNEKNKIDVNYEFIRDKIFKEKEKEKNSIRNRLENLGKEFNMQEEFRQADNEMKKLKLGDYAKGQQK
jgi:Ser-tRNA(Ala) deacylase AlaX